MSKEETDATNKKVGKIDLTQYPELNQHIAYRAYETPLVTLYEEMYPELATQNNLQLFKQVLHDSYYTRNNYHYQSVEQVMIQMKSYEIQAAGESNQGDSDDM